MFIKKEKSDVIRFGLNEELKLEFIKYYNIKMILTPNVIRILVYNLV